jgi:hypothetical protein
MGVAAERVEPAARRLHAHQGGHTIMRATIAIAVLIVATVAGAAVPGTDVYLVSVGHTPGVCVGGVCAQWRTDAWVFNPTGQTASVDIYFYPRGANPAWTKVTVTVAAGETREFADIILTTFGLDPAAGSLRFVADQEVLVTGRIYDANVSTHLGAGTAGAFLTGQHVRTAVGVDENADLIGLAEDSLTNTFRTNVGLVEVTGFPCTVEVEMYSDVGASLGTPVQIPLTALQSHQFRITELGLVSGFNVRVRLRVVSGTGRVLAWADRIDNRTGDPANVEIGGASINGIYVAKLDKTSYDTPLTLTVASARVSAIDATVLVTDEDVPTCSGGELLRVAGSLPTPVLVEEGQFTFSISGSTGGASVTLQVTGRISGDGRLSGSVTQTVSGAGACSGSKAWPLVGARRP